MVMGTAVHVEAALGRMSAFTLVSLPVCSCGMPSHLFRALSYDDLLQFAEHSWLVMFICESSGSGLGLPCEHRP